MTTEGVRARSTPEVVLLVLTGLIAVLLVMAALGVLLIVLIRPDVEVAGVVSSLFDTLKVIIGAVVGYAAGYATVISARDPSLVITPDPGP